MWSRAPGRGRGGAVGASAEQVRSPQDFRVLSAQPLNIAGPSDLQNEDEIQHEILMQLKLKREVDGVLTPPGINTPALQALKRKKRYEKQLSQIDGTLSTIEFQREALENSYTNTEVLKNMGYAAQAMKKAHENMDLNKIDDLMQDIIEQQDVAQEISDAISNRAGFGDEFDEGELMAELEELEQEEMNKTMTNVRLPSVPSTSLPSRPASTRKKAEDEDEMKRLAAWAS
ncbi:charged multivesicular body protein 4c isoform X2 [Dromaius novaehollandiae]|uniref:charged multivesicular body protein 4c isoform X2 n=2 Tax=Dromaius novaehollandiae TaxID=8790 RepID=UPI00311F3522